MSFVAFGIYPSQIEKAEGEALANVIKKRREAKRTWSDETFHQKLEAEKIRRRGMLKPQPLSAPFDTPAACRDYIALVVKTSHAIHVKTMRQELTEKTQKTKTGTKTVTRKEWKEFR